MNSDERLVLEFLAKWEACAAPGGYDAARSTYEHECAVCGLTSGGVEYGGALICKRCGNVLHDRTVIDEASLLRPRKFGSEDGGGGGGGNNKTPWNYTTEELLASDPMARDPLKSDPMLRKLYAMCPKGEMKAHMRETYKPMNFYHYQQYKRKYHLNERIKMRNNVEPRIPLDDLLLLRMSILARLPGFPPADAIDSEAVNIACRALGERFMPYAERWLQVRYFMVTGRTQYDRHVPYDIPPLEPHHQKAICDYFAIVERGFDRHLYKSSEILKRRTPKDNYCGKPSKERREARHNLMQYNHVLHAATYACFGLEEYRRLRTEYCFPLHKSPAALHNLNQMMEIIASEESLPFEPLPIRNEW